MQTIVLKSTKFFNSIIEYWNKTKTLQTTAPNDYCMFVREDNFHIWPICHCCLLNILFILPSHYTILTYFLLSLLLSTIFKWLTPAFYYFLYNFFLDDCWETWPSAMDCFVHSYWYVKSVKPWPLFLWAISLVSVSNEWFWEMRWNHPETKGKLTYLSIKAVDSPYSVFCFGFSFPAV